MTQHRIRQPVYRQVGADHDGASLAQRKGRVSTTEASPVNPSSTGRVIVSREFTALATRAFDELPVAVLWFEGSALIGANDKWSAISGLDVSDSAGDGWLRVIHPDDRDGLAACMTHEPEQSLTPVSLRIVADRRPAEWFRVHLRTACSTDGVATAFVTLTAIGPHRNNQARLVHMSNHDGLTGLANRTRFVSRVRQSLADPTGTSALLFIDLDHFKVVNDHLGHRYGDVVLQAVCKRIERTIRSTDLAGRLGGDEIGVFCPQIAGNDEVIELAERVGAALAAPFSVEEQIVIIDASIGVAYSTDTVTTAEELIDNADTAMYAAKAAGGGRWATYGDDPGPRPTIEVGHDLMFGVIRADVDQAEEHTIAAWKLSTRDRDFERSARLASVRQALRRASLLLRTSPAVDIVTTVDGLKVDQRPDQLQAASHGHTLAHTTKQSPRRRRTPSPAGSASPTTTTQKSELRNV